MDDYRDTKTWSKLELHAQIDQELVRIARSGEADEAANARMELLDRHASTLMPEGAAPADRHALRRAFEDAIRGYRPDRGMPFSMFVEARLRGALRTRHEHGTAGLLAGRFLQVRAATADLEANLDRAPRLHDLTGATGMDRSQVIDAWAGRSADRVRTAQLAAQLADDRVDAREMTDRLRRLDDRARRVLYRLECEGRTRRQVARELGLSSFDVATIERDALVRLDA